MDRSGLTPAPSETARGVLGLFTPRIRRDKAHRYTVRGDDGEWRRAPSVTQVLASLAKPGLVGWAARTQYEADLEAAWSLYSGLPSGLPRWKFDAVFQAEAGSVKAHERLLRRARDHGQDLHGAIEAELRGAPVEPALLTDSVQAGLTAWRRWWGESGLRRVAVEAAVAYNEGGLPLYAGTFDLLAERPDGTLVVADWKSSAEIGHAEQRLQNVAYRVALQQMGCAASLDALLVRVPGSADAAVKTVAVDDDVESAFACFRALATVHAWRTLPARSEA